MRREETMPITVDKILLDHLVSYWTGNRRHATNIQAIIGIRRLRKLSGLIERIDSVWYLVSHEDEDGEQYSALKHEYREDPYLSFVVLFRPYGPIPWDRDRNQGIEDIDALHLGKYSWVLHRTGDGQHHFYATREEAIEDLWMDYGGIPGEQAPYTYDPDSESVMDDDELLW